MGSCPSPSSGATISGVVQLWKEWQVTILVLVTMCLQLLLILAGFVRRHTSNPVLHSVVWVAFIGLDAIAAYAIGVMLGLGCDNVFALWGPIVLFHLGAADAISAYSAADNELWQRHSFKMSLEVVAAGYILSRSANCHKYLASGVLLFIVGAFKYGERISALRGGSSAQVVRSGRAIYKFMALDKPEEDDTQHHPLIVSGESSWFSIHTKNPLLKLKDCSSVVTYNDILHCPELRRAAKYIPDVCLAHALFKIYRRRLANLRIHHKDDDYEKVRKIFFPGQQVSPLKIIRVIDMELSFIFDGVFTKGAAGRLYQGIGIATRLLSVLLLFIVAMDLASVDATHISCESGSVPFAGPMTYILVTVALVLECLQIFKIVRSNWTRVWLACTYITEQRLVASTHNHHLNNFHRFSLRAIITAFRYVGTPKSTHWHGRIGQRSIVVDSMNSVCWHYLKSFKVGYVRMVWEKQAAILSIVDVNAKDVHYYLIEKMAQKLSDVTPQTLARRREQIAGSMRFPFDADANGPRIGPEFSPADDSGLEDAVLNWHLATSVCEMDLLKVDDFNIRQEDSIKMSIALSRYCVHLLISQPKLTPGDPDVSIPLYARLKGHMKGIFLQHPRTMESALLTNYKPATEDPEALRTRSKRESIDPGVLLGRTLMERSMEERWKKLAEVWVDILIYIAIAENAHPHTEQMGKGGELLTHIWVLLGHLGFGQKSWITRPHG